MPLLPIMATLVAPLRGRTGESYRTSSDLTDTQRWLFQLIREHQFGRIENLRVQGGQPLLDLSIKIVRVTRLGGQRNTEPAISHHFELNQSVCVYSRH